ncbi:hypothetical protein LUD75_07270 [Epilithonimonas sp. JDS]|uniref:hypothetical protein n=1 Tax=Epilithonimonas sp. JDS TaxID=2902797 RepID=UPI001E34E7F4|nr:hypothetical protein [Epilithonimonas sp. JDS]MCD9854500.1 hypothetical protein [Epilithonimonas sp. JDS]
MKNPLYILLSFFVLTSCVSQKKQSLMQNILTLKNSYCQPPESYDYEYNLPSKNSDSILYANRDLKPYFKDQSILILNALSSVDEAKAIVDLKKNPSPNSQLEILTLKSQIDGKVNIALTELSSVTAEFDCEGERVEQMARYVDNLNQSRNNKLIIASIVTGAVSSVVGGIASNNSWKDGSQIAGGVLGAGFGLATLSPKGRKTEFYHHRNILRDIWTENLKDKNFPPFIWYMYTEKKFSPVAGKSMLENIKSRWLQYQFDDKKELADQSVIFSDGGKYYSEELHNRVQMLNQMQSITRTINQSINYLLLDLDRMLYKN